MTVYLDIVFLENLIINYIILYETGIISKAKIKTIRLIIASIIGATYSIIYYLVNLKIYSGVVLKIILSIVLIYVGFKADNIKKLIKQILLFYLVSFVFGGAAISIIYMVDANLITIQNGVIIGNYTLKTIFIGIVVAYITIILAYNVIKTKISKKDLICDIKITLNNENIYTKAIIDTGNLLKEPITNIPVVVVEHTLLYDVVPKEILNNLDNILGGDFTNIPDEIEQEYMPKLKVIPFSSLGKQNGMLVGIKADEITINSDEEIKKIDKAIIGIYNKSFTKKGEYRALIGISIL